MKKALALFGFLTLTACGQGNTLGSACTARTDCEAPQTCYVKAPGGTCSKGCAQEGLSVDCTPTSVCAYAGGTTLFCAPTCETDGNCRPDYLCKETKGGKKACVPAVFQ